MFSLTNNFMLNNYFVITKKPIKSYYKMEIVKCRAKYFIVLIFWQAIENAPDNNSCFSKVVNTQVDEKRISIQKNEKKSKAFQTCQPRVWIFNI